MEKQKGRAPENPLSTRFQKSSSSVSLSYSLAPFLASSIRGDCARKVFHAGAILALASWVTSSSVVVPRGAPPPCMYLAPGRSYTTVLSPLISGGDVKVVQKIRSSPLFFLAPGRGYTTESGPVVAARNMTGYRKIGKSRVIAQPSGGRGRLLRLSFMDV